MEQHSISINIFGRKFPMKVDSSEEAAVLEAARLINEQISAFKSIYTTQDDLNIALMCCLKIATDHVNGQLQASGQADQVLEGLSNLARRLEKVVEES